MFSTRRQFIHQSLTSGALLASALGTMSCSALGSGGSRKKQSILILGGTGFLGPALINSVIERGHSLTLFNRGSTDRRRQENGGKSVIPEGVEVIIGNRDPKLAADDPGRRGTAKSAEERDPNSPIGLAGLEGRKFDAVIDTSGYFPRMVKSSAELLADNVDQYVFISTISVYADNSTPGQDETAEVETLEDPTSEDFGERFQNYGGGKAMCEAAAEAAMPGRVTNIRPGYIVGRRDTSRRYLYWPWRVAQGGEMLVPGTPQDPIQIIDVRDLADWTVHCIEQRTMGIFNATGPASSMSMEQMLAGCIKGLGSEATPIWADPTFLREKGMGFPIWASPEGDTAGFHRISVQKAVAAGLTFRTAEETARDTMDWWRSLPEELASRTLPQGLFEQEAEVLAAWKEEMTK